MPHSQTDSPTETEADEAFDLDEQDLAAPAPFARLLPWLLLVGGVIGFVAAFVLSVEKIALLRDPSYVPSCSINPILSCGSVMSKPQAEAFGFPNPLLGIGGFAIVAAIGAAVLADARMRRWYWLGLQLGATFGVVFVHWLTYQSLYSIGALCPYCMVVWAVTIPVFWYVTLSNLANGHLPAPPRLVRVLVDNHAVVLTVWLLGIVGLIILRFWDSWLSML